MNIWGILYRQAVSRLLLSGYGATMHSATPTASVPKQPEAAGDRNPKSSYFEMLGFLKSVRILIADVDFDPPSSVRVLRNRQIGR